MNDTTHDVLETTEAGALLRLDPATRNGVIRGTGSGLHMCMNNAITQACPLAPGPLAPAQREIAQRGIKQRVCGKLGIEIKTVNLLEQKRLRS